MSIKIINPNVDDLQEIIRPVDDFLIDRMVRLAFNCNKATEAYNLRDDIYTSKYNPCNLEFAEVELDRYLEGLGKNVETARQNGEYNWVKINKKDIGEIINRFYIAPNPQNMHSIVRMLTDEFIKQDIPVKFKYQLTTGMEQCDRIIIYSDGINRDRVEAAIYEVYKEHGHLFRDCERSMAWLYDTRVPGVYEVPETPGEAYSDVFANAILEAKSTFNYLYGITEENPMLNLVGTEADRAFEYMKLIIPSILFRKGLLQSNDGLCLKIVDKNVKAVYDQKTGVLKHFNQDSRGYFEAEFSPTIVGKNALLENFYSVSKIKPKDGVAVRYLTLGQRLEELDRFFNPHRYDDSQQVNISNKKR